MAEAQDSGDIDWSLTTWEGARRAQLRAALAMTVRERLQALEELSELSQRLAEMPKTQPQDALRRRIAPSEASARGRRR